MLKCVLRDTTDAFTAEQKQSLIEPASVRLSSIVSGIDGAVELEGDLHGGQKPQPHDYTYNYYDDAMWAVLGGPLSNRQKFNQVSKEWLGWGLRYPSGPTFRTGLATILVASNSTVTAEHAHELFWEFVELFRQIRAVTDGEATLKIFPSQASAFKLMHPDRLGEVVDCRVTPSFIR